MIRVVKVDIECDLRSLSSFFHHAGVRHRIIEESGKQVICVFTVQEQNFVTTAFDKWQKGELNDEALNRLQSANESAGNGNPHDPGRTSYVAIFLKSFAESPITFVLVFITLLVALISRLGNVLDPVAFLFYPALIPTGGFVSIVAQLTHPINFLQAVAPMFLHFGELHIVFNMLWLAVFGRQIEETQSSVQFLLVVIVISLIANTVQFLSNFQTNFGGMSGVVYGLLGYIAVWHWIAPHEGLKMQKSVFLGFLVMLVVMGVVASSLIATPAHIGGLLAGSVIGVILALLKRSNAGKAA